MSNQKRKVYSLDHLRQQVPEVIFRGKSYKMKLMCAEDIARIDALRTKIGGDAETWHANGRVKPQYRELLYLLVDAAIEGFPTETVFGERRGFWNKLLGLFRPKLVPMDIQTVFGLTGLIYEELQNAMEMQTGINPKNLIVQVPEA